ncbi:predicted protein [Lichtheimia corymbifera JMRC:FSU:9682]|uniref:Uncharacterized protein n=1 Tax=Lichtheimia corymbifera JMRC:FSU:9682 TaxID=1263082 RepID=A0A068SGG6_9FUNG|nr:predicted protein [Lichtheimia corymbifera JMRC:FSU:9682]
MTTLSTSIPIRLVSVFSFVQDPKVYRAYSFHGSRKEHRFGSNTLDDGAFALDLQNKTLTILTMKQQHHDMDEKDEMGYLKNNLIEKYLKNGGLSYYQQHVKDVIVLYCLGERTRVVIAEMVPPQSKHASSVRTAYHQV